MSAGQAPPKVNVTARSRSTLAESRTARSVLQGDTATDIVGLKLDAAAMSFTTSHRPDPTPHVRFDVLVELYAREISGPKSPTEENFRCTDIVQVMFRTWQYLRLYQGLGTTTRLAPPMEQYAPLCEAVTSAVIPTVWDAQSALLDELGKDRWELVAHSGQLSTESLIFKRELPGPPV